MKKMLKIIIFVVVFVSFVIPSRAYETIDELKGEIVDTKGIENSISGESKNILGDISVDISSDIAGQSKGIIDRASAQLGQIFKKTTSTMIKIIVVIIISSVGIGFSTSNDLKSVNTYINMATAITIFTLILFDLRSVLNLCSSAINEIDILSKGLMPSMVAAISVSGAPTAAVLNYSASMFAFDLLITLINRVMFPFTYIYIAIITVNAAIGQDVLIKISDFIKWMCTTVLRMLLTIFITYISLSGVVSGTVDALAIKTTKFAISGFIPVVGSIISDATETILVGANVIKNAVGIFGILALFSICIIPFAKILINFLMFKVTSVLVSPIASKQITGLLDGVSSGFNMAFAMISSCAAILFIMMVVSIVLVRNV